MSRPGERGLDEVREAAERIAADARELEDASRPAALTGERPELAPRAGPRYDIRGSDAIHRAEQVRAADDVETSRRQQEAAAQQAAAAAALEDSARGLEASRAALEDARRAAAGGTHRADSVAEGAESLSGDVDRLRRQADTLPSDPAGDEDRGDR
ncbi:MAG: hypothetical protein AB1941_18100 [Gemmatimonadota bacterium]